MTDELYLPPGLMRCPMEVGTKSRRRTEFFYLINLNELTNAVVDGKPMVGPVDRSGTKDFWTDLEIARLVWNLSANAVGEMAEDEKAGVVDATLSLLKDTSLNDLARQFARKENEPAGWHSVLTRPDDGEFLGATILHVADSVFRSQGLKKRYIDLISQRKYKAIRESVYYFEQLGKIEKDKLRPLKRRQAELDESLAIVKRTASRVSNAHMGVVAMLQAAEDKDVRKKLWGTRAPVETTSLLFEEQMVPRLPVGAERGNAVKVRDRFLPSLYRDIADLLAWMASGAKHKGVEFVDAKLRNNRAEDLLEALRENEDLLHLLENHVYVNRLLWRRVERVLLECFHFLLLAPNTREALLEGELGHLAQHVSKFVPDLDVLSDKTRRSREVKAAIGRFVPENEFTPKKTRLSTALVELKSALADPLLERRSTLAKLWSLGTPTLIDHVRNAAETAGDSNPSAVAAGWGWRSAFGLLELDKDTQRDLWERSTRFTKSPTKRNARNIFSAKGLKSEEVFWDAKSGWAAYKTAVAILSATDAVLELGDDPSVEKSIDTWIAALKAVKAVSDLDDALAETQAFARAATTHAKSLHLTLGGGGGFLPIKFVDGVLALLKYRAVAEATEAVLKSKTSSQNEKDHAREKQGLAYVGMFVSLVGTLVGSPMTYAGMLLYLGGEALLDRGLWADYLPSIEGLPGPGRAVKLVWMEMVDGVDGEKALIKLVEGTPWAGAIQDHVTTLQSVTSDASEVGAGAFWPINADNSTARGALIASMLRRQYGIGPELAHELVNELSGL